MIHSVCNLQTSEQGRGQWHNYARNFMNITEIKRFPVFTKTVLGPDHIYGYHMIANVKHALSVYRAGSFGFPCINGSPIENASGHQEVIITRKEFMDEFREVKKLIAQIKP